MTTIDRILSTLPSGSWCSRAKAERMAEIILADKPRIAVEIGVFGGDSLFVIAGALRETGAGKVIGIDHWSKDAALAGMSTQANIDWWSKLDYEAVYRGAIMKQKMFGLQSWCELIRAKSTDPDVLSRFDEGSVGFFHLDGNHGKEQCLADVRAWLPKLAPGATICFDDVGWTESGEQTTYVGFEYLIDHGWELTGMIGDCAFLKHSHALPVIPHG